MREFRAGDARALDQQAARDMAREQVEVRPRAGRRVESEFVRDSFVSGRTLEAVADARRQCASLLAQAGLLGPRPRTRRRGRRSSMASMLSATARRSTR